MESALFSDLLRQAMQRESQVLAVVQQIWGQLETNSLSRAGRIAMGLLEAEAVFTDEITRLALQRGWRQKKPHPIQQLLEQIFQPPPEML